MLQAFIKALLKVLPVIFGAGFLGPVLAEIYLRTPLHEWVPVAASTQQVYIACIAFGAVYGIVAVARGRWI